MSIFDQWDWYRLALAAAIVGCNFFVWRGVFLEESSDRFDKEIGKRWLINGLAWEFFFALVLIVVDTVGSIHQKSEMLVIAERAGNAEQVADRAITQAKTAQERLAKIAKTESELEKRQSNLLDVLTPPQLEYMKFSSDLAGVAPTPIVIEAEPDPTSQFFAADLDAAFRQAHWPQRSIVPAAMGFIPGIWVKYLYSPADDTARKIAQVVCSALNAQLLAKATVFPAITLEAEHERFRRMGLPENIWLSQHGNGPGALEWPETAPAKAVVIHVGQNRNNFFFNNARIKKGLPPLPDVSSAAPPCGG